MTDFFFYFQGGNDQDTMQHLKSLRTGTRDYLYIKQHILSGSRLGRVMDRSGESSCVT